MYKERLLSILRRIQLDAEKAENRDEIERERIASQEQIAGVKIGQDIARDLLELEEREDSKKREDYKLGLDIAKDYGSKC